MEYLLELRQRFAEVAASTTENVRISRFLSVAKEFVSDKKSELNEMHLEGAGGAAVVARYTSLADAVVTSIYSAAAGNKVVSAPHALVALGGYGRKELCFCSDLDIMLLHEGRLDRELEVVNDSLLYFLWDVGFVVGHSIRSMAESLKLARQDDTILTSMLESRLLAGEAATFERFMDKLFTLIRSMGVKNFVRRKERERARNYLSAGDEVYHREPNIKLTAGGLRDYHTGVWVALAQFRLKSSRQFFEAGLLTEEQFLKLERALDFMWRVRNQIHLENGPLHDVLTLSRQEQIAHAFGYRASRGSLAVELFMQDYYTHACELHRFYKEMLRLGGLSETRHRELVVLRGGKIERGLRIARRMVYLPAKDANWFRENPARLLELVWYSQKQGLLLSERALSSIKANLGLIDEQFRASPVTRNYFLAILSDLSRVGSTARQMCEIGILDRYIPEFSAIRHVVRYDPFHQYPVDEHTLRALENLAAIPHLSELGTDILKKILSEIKAPEILSLAILLHDLGKTEEGSHVGRGVQVAEAVGNRLALNEPQLETLRFLIRNHLKMTHLSQYRDIDDMDIIRSFASEVGSEENLNMLYLLTFADIYAVRQGAWSDWKSALLHQLYLRTSQALAHPHAAEREQAEYWAAPKARAICEYLPKGDFAAVKKHLRLLTPRYLSSFSPEEVANHMRMVSTLERKTSASECVALPNYSLSQVTVCAKDRLGLFADIVGTFASQRVSVLSASAFTRSDGIAIDSFYVVDGETDGPLSPAKWGVVKENLRKVLRGERKVAELLQDAERSPRIAQRKMSSLRRGVYFDNRVSAAHTVIDIEAPDRIGLLYDIASTFSNLGLNILLAKITTDVRQARDAFYVTDREEKKITELLRIQEIRERIDHVLNAGISSVSFKSKGTRRRVKTK